MYQKKQLTELQWISITYRITKYVTKKEIGCLTLMNYGMDQKGGRKLGCIRLRRVETKIEFWLSTQIQNSCLSSGTQEGKKGEFWTWVFFEFLIWYYFQIFLT